MNDLIFLDMSASFTFNATKFTVLPVGPKDPRRGFGFEEPSHGREFEQAHDEESIFKVNEPSAGYLRFRVTGIAVENMKGKLAFSFVPM